MAGTTSRLGLEYPQTSDLESAFPAVSAQQMGILDNAAIYAEGTLVSRAISEHGQFYRTTDSGAETFSWTDGSLWLPLGLIPASTSVSASVVSGQALITTGGSALTATLPSHAAGQMVAVLNYSTGGTTVSGSSIQGIGLSSASSFPLGMVGAGAVLLDDGTNWRFLAGQQDTGWVSLTLGTNIGAGSGYTPAARVVGNGVELCGAPVNNTGSSATSLTTWATIPLGLRPASPVSAGSASTPYEITTGGVITYSGTVNNGSPIFLDEIKFRLS
jgi:hypothetical protein